MLQYYRRKCFTKVQMDLYKTINFQNLYGKNCNMLLRDVTVNLTRQ